MAVDLEKQYTLALTHEAKTFTRVKRALTFHEKARDRRLSIEARLGRDAVKQVIARLTQGGHTS